MSIDILCQKIRETKNPSVAGLDPKLDFVPGDITARHIAAKGETLEAAADALYEFNRGLCDALSGIVPAVKLQSAYYEMYGPEGVAAFKKTVDYARAAGFYVMADVKRNDIGSTAEAYASAYLGSVTVGRTVIEPFGADSATVNPYLGTDGLKPFIDACAEGGKSIFVLVKTSNPSSFELQELIAGDRPVYRVMASLVERWGQGLIGASGYSEVGAVVGATHPAQLRELRELYPSVFFLVPGYGAQGGGAEDAAFAFRRDGSGAVINSSRGIMCAYKKTGGDFKDAARQEALRMKEDIRLALC